MTFRELLYKVILIKTGKHTIYGETKRLQFAFGYFHPGLFAVSSILVCLRFSSIHCGVGDTVLHKLRLVVFKVKKNQNRQVALRCVPRGCVLPES